jgi:hypothetical protein
MHMHLAIAVAVAIGLFCLAAILLAFWCKKRLRQYYEKQYLDVTKQVSEAENKTYSPHSTYITQLKPSPTLWFWLLPKTFFVAGITLFTYLLSPFVYLVIQTVVQNFSTATSSDLITFFSGSILFILGIIYVCLWLVKALWLLTGKEIITIDNTNLTRKRTIAGIPLTTRYDLSHISDPRIAIMEDSNTSLFFRGNYQGFSVYYKNPVLLYFTYKGSKKRIGNYCAYFNAVELREEITGRKG